MQVLSVNPKAQGWKKYAVLRKTRHLLRVFWPYWSSARTWASFKHRLYAPQASFLRNRRKIVSRLAEVRLKQKNRPIVAISQVFHLGDIVACEPMIRKVRKANPHAFLVMCVQRNYAETFNYHPDIDYILPLECLTEWIYFTQSTIFDQVIDLNIHGRACWQCGEELVKPEGKRGVTYDNYFNWGSLLEAYSRSAGLEPPDDGPRLYTSSSCRIATDALGLPTKFVALHAGSNKQETQLPHYTWQRVVRHINERWKTPVVEIGITPLVVTTSDSFNRNLCGRLSILQSAEVIRRSQLYLGSDSGPAHLANAVGTYGIIALGHLYHWRTYVPYSGGYANGGNCQLLHHDGPVSDLPVEVILDAVDRRLGRLAVRSEQGSAAQETSLPIEDNA